MASDGKGGIVWRLQRQAECFRSLGKDGSVKQWDICCRPSGLYDGKRRLGRGCDWICAVGKRTFNGEKGIDLFRFKNGLTKEVWLFSERIDEGGCFWTALAQG